LRERRIIDIEDTISIGVAEGRIGASTTAVNYMQVRVQLYLWTESNEYGLRRVASCRCDLQRDASSNEASWNRSANGVS
jgi:hypothetical protein